MDDDQIRLLLEELSSSSSYEDENDSEVEDNVEVQEETYDTEQDDDNDEISEEEHNERSHDFYLGKDGQTRWNKSPASNPTRRRARNIVTQLPGAREEARNLKEPDAKMFYTHTMEVYVGKQPDGPNQVDNSALALVLRLSENIYNTGRNITCDNFFTSIPLINKLESQHKLTVIGTIRKNKRELPKHFTEIRGRAEKSSLFGHRGNCSLVSYVPKKGKNVLLVSSMHDDAQINEDTGKPEIIMDYIRTKGGVDSVDKMCETYNVARGTNRWPMVIFYSLMNVAGINTFIIYLQNNPNKKISRRVFLEALAYDLINPQLRRRALISSLPRNIRLRLTEICKLDGPESAATSNNNKVGRCGYCSSKKNRKTRYNCATCKKYFCLEHAVTVCPDCYGEAQN
ncbi:PiggyBac transposable element-derived protein 4 [Eumeta japonica]|uniref:PiggyBac transposable element-derived protein 4 n=1 Tax=Eumeta variegata TaxID=151549 RepID=A0A4C1YXJ5_EUMVA|nr:PiggyBac transposable element-derived protein 4 [Eumeta japonica]